MAYLYTRQIIIDLGPQNKESFYDEEIYSDSYPSLNMDHLRNSIGIYQYAVSNVICDPSEDLRYLQFAIDAPGKDTVRIDNWNRDEWGTDKMKEYLEDVPDAVITIIMDALGGAETSDFTGEVEDDFDKEGWRCELVQTEGAHQVPFDEDELETFDLERFYGIWVIHKHGEIDDSMLKDVPNSEVDPNWTEEEKEEYIEYDTGIDFDFEEDDITLLERLMAGEICEDYDDEYEVFGYVTATTDGGEDEDEDDFEEDEE